MTFLCTYVATETGVGLAYIFPASAHDFSGKVHGRRCTGVVKIYKITFLSHSEGTDKYHCFHYTHKECVIFANCHYAYSGSNDIYLYLHCVTKK